MGESGRSLRLLAQRAIRARPRSPGLIRLAVFFLAACLPLACAGEPFAYVSNEKSGTVSVIDTQVDRVVAEIPAGGKPRGMAISRDGRRLYVSDQGANALRRAARTVTKTIDLGESPEGVSLSPDGSLIAAASELANSVVLIDASDEHVIGTVRTARKNPEQVAWSACMCRPRRDSQVDVIERGSRRQITSIPVARRPRGHRLHARRRARLHRVRLDSTIFVVNAVRHRVIGSIPGGQFSNGVTVSPDGERVYVSNGREASVSVIDARIAEHCRLRL